MPLIVRGPGIAANYTAEGVVTTHADLAPTFFELLGIEQRDDFDGAAIPVTREGIEEVKGRGERREHAGIEYWGMAMGEGIYNRELKKLKSCFSFKIAALYLRGHAFEESDLTNTAFSSRKSP